MKKILTAVALLATTASFAQLSQGSIIATGFGSISSTSSETELNGTTTDNPDQFSGTFGLGGGYFIADGLSVGLFASFGSTNTNDKVNDVENNTSTNTFGLGARKYVRCADKLYVFGQLGVAFGGNKNETRNQATTVVNSEGSFFTAGIAPGISFFPSECLAFDVTVGNLGYTSVKNENPTAQSTTTNNTFGLNFNLTTINFGVSVFFNSGGSSAE